MERKYTVQSSLNPSILHVSKSSPSLTQARPHVPAARMATQTSAGKRGAVAAAHKRHKARNIVANRDRPTMQRKPYLILEKGVNYTPMALYDPAFPSSSEKAFAGLPAAKPLQAAGHHHQSGSHRSTLTTMHSELVSASSSMHSMMSTPSRFSMGARPSRASVAVSMVSGGLASLSEISWMTPAPSESGAPGSEAGSGQRAPSMFRLREDPPPKRAEVRTKFIVNITESETKFMLNLPTQSEPVESEDSKTIEEANADYERVINSNRAISQTATQTTSIFQKHRKLYAPRGSRKNNTAWATVWDIYDTYEELKRNSVASASIAEEGQVDIVVHVPKEDENYNVDFEYLGYKLDDRFLNALMLMERFLVKDSFSESQLLFQGLLVEDPLSLDVKYNYKFTTLWTFADSKTAHRRVTSMCWSPHNGNVLAVGYGKFKYTDTVNGLVCVWNVKNPKDPERLYEFDDPVTFVAFSETRGQILAVSFYSGLVLLIDIISRVPLIKASNYMYPLYHPVWQARWFPVDNDSQGQYLATCGRNGRVYRYRKTKFFISKKLLTVSRPHGSSVQGVEQPKKCYARKTLSTRSPSAEVLVLHPTDPLQYLVGTSEGCVYFCSANHRHDHMDVFVAHNGPVYNIQFNPFCPKVFLTCGADWCIRIWAETVYEPLATLESGMNAVQCALWNPLHSTVIVSGTGGRLEVWDLRRRTSAPKSSVETPGGGAPVTSLQFTSNRFNLCVGDADGRVHVMTLTEMPFSPSFQEEILAQAIDQMLITRPSVLARLRRLGPPFTPPDSTSLQARMYRRLGRLHKNIA